MATLLGLTPQQKAALVVVSGLPAPPGVGGVIVQGYDRDAARPPGALVFVDQEGGKVQDLPAPAAPVRRLGLSGAPQRPTRPDGRPVSRSAARASMSISRPVLDLPDGPLGSRQFRSPSFGVAFARGLAAGGAGACAKHFPGLGSLPVFHGRAAVRARACARGGPRSVPGGRSREACPA